MNTSPEFKGIKTVLVLVLDATLEMNTSPEFKGIKTIGEVVFLLAFQNEYQP